MPAWKRFFQIFGIYSSKISELIPVFWNLDTVWVMLSAVVSNVGKSFALTQFLSGAVSNAGKSSALTQVVYAVVSNAGFSRRLTQFLLRLCQM